MRTYGIALLALCLPALAAAGKRHEQYPHKEPDSHGQLSNPSDSSGMARSSATAAATIPAASAASARR